MKSMIEFNCGDRVFLDLKKILSFFWIIGNKKADIGGRKHIMICCYI